MPDPEYDEDEFNYYHQNPNIDTNELIHEVEDVLSITLNNEETKNSNEYASFTNNQLLGMIKFLNEELRLVEEEFYTKRDNKWIYDKEKKLFKNQNGQEMFVIDEEL